MKLQKKYSKTPRLGVRLLKQIFPDDFGWYTQLGDVEETFNRIAVEKNVFIARVWYWMVCIRSIPGVLKNKIYWSVIMFRNYFITAVRIAKRSKIYLLINISGLAIGMAACLVIYLYIHKELSYDRFHNNYDRIYRVTTKYGTVLLEDHRGLLPHY